MSVNAGKRDRLEYIQDMLFKLRMLANADDLGILAHLLEMAYLEAGDQLHSHQSAQREARQ